MSDSASKRRWPRFSLITLIVAVNVAGVLVWANLAWREVSFNYLSDAVEHSEHAYLIEHYPAIFGPMGTTYRLESHGWPYGYDWRRTSVAAQAPVDIGSQKPWARLAANCVIGLALVICAGLLTESIVRKLRKAKRHDG